ncbi:MAG: metal ABC transporter substrate-binding protein [Lachnospiraceae bacterium]|nr:metal ABC transporter substrate-binding protein [Lachnospiraceae bacterium]
MKKKSILMFVVMAALCCLAGCSNAKAAGTEEKASEKLSIVTTIFPEYDWVREIVGTNDAEITMLLDNGVDLHSFQPTAQDILKISACDMFIYVGGESDEWVEDALAEATNKDMVVINLLDSLGDRVKAEEIVEGMEHEHDHDHDADEHDGDHDHEEADEHDGDHDHEEADEHDGDHDHEEADEHDEDHDHEHEEEMDEHVWLSLNNASFLCDVIAEQLKTLDPEHADSYAANVSAYKEKLSELDGQYRAAVEASSVDTLLFGDRFPFRYLVDDYGLSYYAAFAGCSAESEASFETIVFLAEKTDELKLPAIMTIEGKTHRIAETVRDNTASKDQKILTLDSLQSVTSEDVKAGTTYLSVMQSNLEVLKEALQ